MDRSLDSLLARLELVERLLGIGEHLSEIKPNLRTPYSNRILGVMRDEFAAQLAGGEMVVTLAGMSPGSHPEGGRDWVISGSEPGPALLVQRSEGISQLAGAFSSLRRVQVAAVLVQGQRTWADIVKATGLSPGQLYHHVQDLLAAGMLEQPERSVYRLTPLGISLITVLALIDGYRERMGTWGESR